MRSIPDSGLSRQPTEYTGRTLVLEPGARYYRRDVLSAAANGDFPRYRSKRERNYCYHDIRVDECEISFAGGLVGIVLIVSGGSHHTSLRTSDRGRMAHHYPGRIASESEFSLQTMRVCYEASTTLLALLVFTIVEPDAAEGQTVWQPSPGHTQIPIWPAAPPNARRVGREFSKTVVDSAGKPRLVGGKPWVYVDSVSQPTIPSIRH